MKLISVPPETYFMSSEPSPFHGNDNCLSIDYHRAAIQVWDKLIDFGYDPACIINCDIFLRLSDFKDLMIDLGGECSIMERQGYRYSCTWMDCNDNNLPIKVMYRERIDQESGDWESINNWKPLR